MITRFPVPHSPPFACLVSVQRCVIRSPEMNMRLNTSNDHNKMFPPSQVNGRKLEPHSELGLFSLSTLHLLDLSRQNFSKSPPDSQPSSLPSGTLLVLPELFATLPGSLKELRL